jgi:uncharacterized protein with HEPN domain
MSERSVPVLLQDILTAISRINTYTQGLSFDDFTAQFMTQDAVFRNFTIIGEAIARLPDSFKQTQTQVNWRIAKDFRNRIVHDYFGIDLQIAWNAIRVHLPVLNENINQILSALDETY